MRWSKYGRRKLALSRSIAHYDRMIAWAEGYAEYMKEKEVSQELYDL